MSSSFTTHVVYYEDRKQDLLADCLVPLARRARKDYGAEAVFLERHWRFGPHVRVNVVGARDDAREKFARDARPAIEAYLRRVPSRAPLDRAAYLRLSSKLASAELVLPPYGPVWPDNTVVVGTYQPRVDLYGEAGAGAKARFLTGALEPVALVLDRTRDDRRARLDHVLRLLVLVAAAYSAEDVAAGTLSFRSHVEDYLTHEDRDGRVRAAFASKYAELREALVEVVREVADDAADGGYRGPDDLLAAWSALFRDAERHLTTLTQLHEIDESPTERYYRVASQVNDEARARWDFERRRRFGAFHQSLRGLDFLAERRNVAGFSTYRWIVNLAYLTLPLLDVSPAERYLLTYLVAHAADEVVGVPWDERLKALGAAGGAR
ncbi:MAG TPA: lantibiotic dehydratase C-terminal domain-containing protein [Frankiaceae bacterium]|nr:lantibiotic dehydratase C-terminal domain-containing protein [Frankiaceae bacterium]